MQPIRGRTAGGGRPALATGVFLLVASLVLLVSAPGAPSPSSFPTSASSRTLAEVLGQGPGAAAVAAAGGRSLAALPIVDGLLAQVPAAAAPRLPDHPGVRAVTDADRPLRVRAADPLPGGVDPLLGDAGPLPGAVDSPTQSLPGSASVPLRGASPPEAGVTAAGASAGQGVAVGVLDTGIAASGDLAGRVAEETGPAGRERADDGPPPGARARRARNPLCRCS